VSVTAILFALGHLTPQTWFPVALLGVVLGFVRWETGSLVPSILVHATFNAVPFYRMAAQRPGAPEPGQLPAWMIGVSGAVALLLVAAFAAIGRSKSARLAQEFDLAGVRKR
jgi:membrane protease YdiL (CAAX protease family)